jgi:hypothetical protein
MDTEICVGKVKELSHWEHLDVARGGVGVTLKCILKKYSGKIWV